MGKMRNLALCHFEIGDNGIVLSYMIRQNSVPDHSDQLMWDEKAISAAPHTGKK